MNKIFVSDNQLRADNQQERLINIGWIIGFVDGKGCFSVGFIKQPTTKTRKGYKTGYQIMNHQKSRKELIKILRDYASDAHNQMGDDIVPTVWRHAGPLGS
jgi:hypothetical protein